jgi:hypothetical protein
MADSNGNGSANPLAGKGLDPNQLAEVMAGARGRGIYGPRLKDFMESDEAAIEPAAVWPMDFEGKAASSLYQSFKAAAEKAKIDDEIRLLSTGGKFYLIHNERANALREEAEATA